MRLTASERLMTGNDPLEAEKNSEVRRRLEPHEGETSGR